MSASGSVDNLPAQDWNSNTLPRSDLIKTSVCIDVRPALVFAKPASS